MKQAIGLVVAMLAGAGAGVGASSGTITSETPAVSVRWVSLRGLGGQENWSSLSLMPDGQVLLGLSSRSGSGALVQYDPVADKAWRVAGLDDMGRLGQRQRQPKIHVSPVATGPRRWEFFSHFGQDSHLMLHGSSQGYEGMRRYRYDVQRGVVEDLGGLPTGQGAVAQASSADGQRLFVSVYPGGQIVEFSAAGGAERNLGRANGCYACRQILMDPRDCPWVLDHQGRFWTLDGGRGELVPTQVRLPVGEQVDGHLLAQGFVSACAVEGRRSWLAMSAWGQLYRVDFAGPQTRVTDLGMPARELIARAQAGAGRLTAAGLALGKDGWLYLAVSGYNLPIDGSGDSFILRCRPDGQGTQMVCRLDGRSVSYLCGSQVVEGQSGTIYFAACHLQADNPGLVVLTTKEVAP